MLGLKNTFYLLAGQYLQQPALVNPYWQEIEKAYSHKKRHYHNLTHLQNLLEELAEIKPLIKDWDTVLFTLFYHDVVYNARKSDNEEKSAELAVERMKAMGVAAEKAALCQAQILATKSHALSQDNDTNLFTDADLCILGKEWSVYEKYFQQVRKEYSIYPDLLYRPGRRKVLQHFLAMERIFKTDAFFEKYESQARQNLGKEIEVLS